MNKTWVLLRAQILNFLPINELRGPGNKKKTTTVILGLGIVTLVLLLSAYNILTIKALAQAGEQELIPAYMVSLSSFSILFLTLFCSNGILFGSRDFNILSSLPVKSGEVIGSKFLFMYLLNLLIAVVIMMPGGIVWIAHVKTDVLRFALFLLSVFFVPLIPMCAASMAGVLIVFVSSRFKNRSLFAVLLSFLALGLIAYRAFLRMQSGDRDISDIGAILAGQITGLYPIANLFLQGANNFGTFCMGLFPVLSVIVLFLFIRTAAVKYGCLNAMASGTSRYRRRLSPLRGRSPFIALYQKELGRFFSSYMAVLNTGLGVAILCLFGVVLLLMSPETLGEYAGIPDMNGFTDPAQPGSASPSLSDSVGDRGNPDFCDNSPVPQGMRIHLYLIRSGRNAFHVHSQFTVGRIGRQIDPFRRCAAPDLPKP